MRRITLPTGVLATALGVLALAAPASAATSSQLDPAEAWQQIVQDNLRDLQAVEAWQHVAQDNLRDLQAQERRARRRAKKKHHRRPASASAVTSSQLERAGWDCIAPVPVTDQLHCAPPGGLAGLLTEQAPVVDMLVFDSSGTELLGTEHNVRGDVFHGQRCPTDPPSYEYTHLLPIFGIDYWACHRFDSDHL